MDDTTLDRDIEDYLGVRVPMRETEGTEPEILPAPDEAIADKLLWRARRLRAEAQRIRDHAAARITEIREWEADRTAGIEGEQRRVRRSLEGFTRAFIRANPKRKSVPLSNGTLKLTAPGQGKIEITDEHVLVKWCEDNGRPDLLRYKPEPAKAAIKAIEERHPGPPMTASNDDGQPERWETWHIMATIGEGDERELVKLPGVTYMRRAEDRFAVTLQGESEPEHEETEL